MPTTEAQLLANRANGQKSQGPITDEGKAIASRNSLKHGLLSNTEVLLPDETEDDLKAFTDGLRADLQPQGAMEDLLFQRVVNCAWRLKRASRIEASLLKWYVHHEYVQRANDRIKDCFLITSNDFPNAPLFDPEGMREAGHDKMGHKKKRDAPDTALGRAFVRDIKESDALMKLSRYERGLERSMLRNLWGLQETQCSRRNAKNISP